MAEIDMMDIAGGGTVHVTLRRYREFRIRMAVALFLMRIACKVAGFAFVADEECYSVTFGGEKDHD